MSRDSKFSHSPFTPGPVRVEGNFHVAVERRNGKVILDFGQNLSYIELEPDKADALAALLQKQAMAARIGV